MFKAPKKYRQIKNIRPEFITNESHGNNGLFLVKKNSLFYYCLISDGMNWDHVSISITKKTGVPIKRTCTWEEMCMIKDIFWDKEDTVIQIHPPEKEYVNKHEYVLHLWKMQGVDFPLPNSLMVGIKDK